MGTPMVIALNMMDALEENGFSIDVEKLQKKLGIRIMPISASKGRGVQDLITECLNIASKKQLPLCPLTYGAKIEKAVNEIQSEEGLNRL